MADGKSFFMRSRPAILSTLTALPKYTALARDTAQGTLKMAGVGDKVVAVLAEVVEAVSAARVVQVIDLVPGTVVPMISSAAVAMLTGSKLSRLVAAADGEVKILPTTVGTYEVIGTMDWDTPASGADQDIVHVYVAPETVKVVADAVPLQFHVSDTTNGVTSTKFASYTLPTGVSATVRGVQVTARSVGAAGATIDVKEGTGSILSAVIDAATGGATVAGTVSDTAIAAGATLNLYYTTGASTGTLVDATVTLLLSLSA